MPLLAPSISLSLLQSLSSKGFVGIDLPRFTLAFGTGIQLGITGTTFTTNDTGSVAGAGVGVGIGVTIPPGVIKTQIIAKAPAVFGQLGLNLPDFADAIDTAVLNELKKATLTSTHTPVFIGTGIISSIAAKAPPIKSSIISAALGFAIVGPDFERLADITSDAIATVLRNGSGQVTITGAGSNPPSPGSGTGSGFIS